MRSKKPSNNGFVLLNTLIVFSLIVMIMMSQFRMVYYRHYQTYYLNCIQEQLDIERELFLWIRQNDELTASYSYANHESNIEIERRGFAIHVGVRGKYTYSIDLHLDFEDRIESIQYDLFDK